MKTLILLLILTVASTLNAQSFTKDKEKFNKDWSKFPLESKASEFCKKDLEDLLKSPQLSDSKFSKMVDGCNSLEKKGVSANPDIFNYMISFLFQNVNKFDTEFNQQWGEIFAEIYEKQPDQLSDFLLFSSNLFRYKALIRDANYGWYFQKGEFEWLRDKKLQLICKNGDLICFVPIRGTNGDSLKIKSTNGVFEIASKRWEGRGGLITWEKVKINKDETFANLKGYKADFNKTVLKADSVALTTPYFQQPILGKLTDKTILDLSEGEKVPQFVSYEKRLKIPNLRKNVDYDGSFTLEGDDFVGKGVEGKPAKMIFKVAGKTQLEVSSLEYQITPVSILSKESSLKLLYKNGDSLTLQKGLLLYNLTQEELKITAANQGGTYVPFCDSYFNLYVRAPILVWSHLKNVAYYTFDVGTSQEQKYAVLESKDNFDGKLYSKYNSANAEHPFQLIAKKAITSGRMEFGEGELASSMNRIVDQIKPLMVDMTSDGFVQYNGTTKKIKVEQKLIDYVLSQNGEKDYDNLSITSDFRPIKIPFSDVDLQNNPELQFEKMRIQDRNKTRQLSIAFARIKIDELEMNISEVDQVTFSENQKVIAFCDSSKLTLKKNRDMYFSGWLTAGKMDVYCNNSIFDYENFKVNILSSRDAYFNFKPMKTEDGNQPIASPSSISNLTGELLIDLPSSRSGKKAKMDEYPKLVTRLNSKVYYNDKSILNGAYDSTRFYYEITPFELDSLDNFKEKALAFNGELNSGGIFPKLKEKLIVMNDYSLGFFTKAPEEGLPFYGTENRYKNKIALSQNGLQGSGTIEFLEATAVSKLLTFLPDSAIGIAQFSNKQKESGIKFPEANSTAALLSYQPKLGVLKVSSYNGQLISMFNKEVTLTGTLVLQKSGATGSGLIDFKEASLEAKDFRFTDEDIDTDHSNFAIRNRFTSHGENPLAIQSIGFKGHVSFNERMGEFTSNVSKRIKFPANNYYCQMDKFIWQMDAQSIDFEKSGVNETNFESGMDLVTNNFFSMDPNQDSLQFKSLSATYDLKTQTINCRKVEFVQVGDARIFPDSMKVRIRKAAKMDLLKNAIIVANYITKYHKFTDANISILSRNTYEGNCSYPYFDRDSLVTIIPMQSIVYRKEKKETVVTGEILERMNFKLSKEFDYFGKISILASTPGLILSGSTRINHDCSYDKSWFNFSDTINPKKIQIPVNQKQVNTKNEPVLSGFAWRNSLKLDSLRVYQGFLSKKERETDIELLSASGFVQYNDVAHEFQIGTKSRLQKLDTLSTLYSLHLGTCILSGFGPINLGINYGETSIKAYGKLEFNPSDKKTSTYLNVAIDMQVPKDVMEIVANKIKADENLKEVDLKAGKYGLKNNFAYWIAEEHERVFKDFDEDRLKKMPDELDQTLILSGVRLESLMGSAAGGRKAERGFISDKNATVGLVSISGIPVLKELNTRAFFAQRYSSDETQFFGINLDVNEEKFFYLNHQMDNKNESTLSFVTNDSELKKTILAIKPKKRKAKNFKFELAEGSEAKNLVAKFKSVFQNR
ncbi:MAG: hypothetical protein EBS34_01680 [Flavobacteriales bacterium]|nr:hypothetical protein [Flavobacteriales bacterium]